MTEWSLLIAWIAAIWFWLQKRTLLRAIPFTLVSLALAAIAMPSVRGVHTASIRMACIANLRAIADAKAQWARENSKLPTDTPADTDLYGEAKPLPRKPECPQRGNYVTGAAQDNPKCSFADEGHRL